jgi:NADH:ubiquinone oxidoreductase subunit F (NADH-binding)/NADH:ubiquinone oxidoreductase subunit E
MPVTTAPPSSSAHRSPIFDELRAIQQRHRYLPAVELRALAARHNLPLFYLNGVASFYPHFYLAPPARAEVRVCDDMSCHLSGGGTLLRALEGRAAALGPAEMNVKPVSCLGRCDLAPAIVVNDAIYEGATLADADRLIANALNGTPTPLHVSPSRVRLGIDPYDGEAARYGVVRQLAVSGDRDGVIATLKASALRGLGGAGFPTGMKWETVRNAPGAQKYIVCNADESEPGTIKDRHIMRHAPHLVVEGMIVAGLVTGATHGIFYIRHEYHEQERIIEKEIRDCYAAGILGDRVGGSNSKFDLEVFVSPGGYICGEESALLEAIEGKRAEPRNKPPFPALQGLWQKPTVINNVETFAFATAILARGADWYKAQGVNGSAGSKFIGVSGHVQSPGVFEIPMGITYRQLIYDHAGGPVDGHHIKAFAPSGPAGGYLPAASLDLPIDWAAMQKAGSTVGSGAVVVCDERACMLDMALNAVRFFRNESCGKCVPCRVGSAKLTDMLTAWTRGERGPADAALMDELPHALRLTSICGLGQVVPAPIQTVLAHFGSEVDAHLMERRCAAGVCFTAAQLKLRPTEMRPTEMRPTEMRPTESRAPETGAIGSAQLQLRPRDDRV